VAKVHASKSECGFTITKAWLDNVRQALDPLDVIDWADIGEFESGLLQTQATNTYSALWSRLATHIQTKVKDPKKHNHWVWDQFVRENLAVVAAYMVYAKHININLESAATRPSQCLLRSPYASNNFIELTGTDAGKKLEGAYMHFDPERCVWVRTGKKTGTPFVERLKEHAKASLLTDTKNLESRFYCMYPSACASVKSGSRLGTHEQLRAYSAMGYSSGMNETWKLLEREGERSLFRWSARTLRNLGRSFGKMPTLGEKKRNMISYLFEVCYQLALAPICDVSDGPSFEVFMITRK
jgi:hypothetical protein